MRDAEDTNITMVVVAVLFYPYDDGKDNADAELTTTLT